MRTFLSSSAFTRALPSLVDSLSSLWSSHARHHNGGTTKFSNNPRTHREFFFFNAVSSDSLVRNASTALDLPSSASFNRSSNWNTFSAISRS